VKRVTPHCSRVMREFVIEIMLIYRDIVRASPIGRVGPRKSRSPGAIRVVHARGERTVPAEPENTGGLQLRSRESAICRKIVLSTKR